MRYVAQTMTSLVLSGLIAKRAELLRDITIAKDRLAMCEADLASIEGAIRVFDPDIELQDKGRRVPAVHAAPEGDMARYILDCLRAAKGPLKSSEIASYVMEQRQLDPRDKRLQRTMAERTYAALSRLRGRALVRSEAGAGGLLMWRLAN